MSSFNRMKNSVSDRDFYIECDDDDDVVQTDDDDVERADDDDGNRSDSSVDDQQNKPGSYVPSWPQSYRQSIDLYSSIQSPNIVMIGASQLQRFGSSLLSSSLLRRNDDTYPPYATNPLISKLIDEQKPSFHSPIRSRKPSISKDDKTFIMSQEFPECRTSSFGHAVLNGMNVLCGVGILSTPYAAREGGWLGLSILLIFAVLSFYTGILLRYCLDSEPGLETYPDIGQAAFGTVGRVVISIILYVELYACAVEYIILESDNLSSLFPNAHMSLGWFELSAQHLFALVVTLAILPTVWLRDLSLLSYLSAGGVIASVMVVLCLFWIDVVDHVGLHSKGTALNLATLPVSIGLYGYCYSGHAVFPNIYTSMADRNQYPRVLLTCFGLCTSLYVSAAIMGYTMFGDSTKSQFTLNMPQNLVASKIAVWTTVVNPFTKYALTISPVALSLEELLPSSLLLQSHMYAVLIRTVLVFSTLFVGLVIPFFGLVMSLIGSFLTMLVTLILPCACFLSILRAKVTRLQVIACVIIISVGVVASVVGTYSAVSKIIERLSG